MTEPRKDIRNSSIPLLCRSCEARHKRLCGALDAAQLTELARHTRKTLHSAGEELIGEGTEISSYANVMGGVAKLTRGLEDGRQRLIQHLRPVLAAPSPPPPATSGWQAPTSQSPH